MSSLIKNSDDVLYNNSAWLTFEHKKENDAMFMSVMASPHANYKQTAESFFTDSRLCFRNKTDNTPLDIRLGYDAFPNGSANDYLLIPCPVNTFTNHTRCDDAKCCSVHHQLFMNVTKPKSSR
jgi:hypothetical protein